MKKYALNIVSFVLESSGAKYSTIPVLSAPENIISVNTPPQMIVNRVTFQCSINLSTTSWAAFLINNRPFQNHHDGVLLVAPADANAVIQPVKHTFENFNGEEIKDTFYIANISDDADNADIQIIFEGYER